MAPKRQLLWVAVVAGVCVWLAITVALREPSLGVRWRAPDTGDGLVAESVRPGGACGGLLPEGARVLSLSLSDGDEATALSAETLLEEPDYLRSYADLELFFAHQDQLAHVLASQEVELSLASGEPVLVTPGQRRLADLPPVFWFQLLCGLVAFLTGAAVFVFRKDEVHARYYGLSGAMLLSFTYPAAIYSGRELALPTSLFRPLAALDHLGAMIFGAAFVALFWNYPRKLHRTPAEPLIFTAYLGVWLADVTQLLPNTDWGIRIPIIVGLLTAMVFARLQFRRAAGDPVSQTALRWFALSTLMGSAIFTVTIFIVVSVGGVPVIPQGYAFGVLLMMYIGIALGIVRYRLFDLDRWWVAAWLWMFAGAAIVCVDLAIAYVLRLDDVIALSVSVALVGWVYFPARQWLMKKLTRRRHVDASTLFPDIVALVLGAESRGAVSSQWHELLRHLFEPLVIDDLGEDVPDVRIAQDGRSLCVPSVAGAPSTRISLPAGGHRLFGPNDRDLVTALLALLEPALRHREAFEEGTLSERKRIARDLHDDVGTRLLTLVHSAETGPVAEVARDALSDLRLVISSLGAPPCSLEDALADWRSEAVHRCNAAGVTLEWRQPASLDETTLDPRQRLNILRVLRESMTNALRHSKPSAIGVTATISSGCFELVVEDDGDVPPPESWTPGRGLNNIEHRVSELGGDHRYEACAPRGARLCLSFPLTERTA